MQLKDSKIGQATHFKSSTLNWGLFYGFTLLFMANLFASIAIFPAYSLVLGSTPFQAGLQSTVFAAAAVILRIYLAPFMDRRGPKPLMLIGVFTFATAPLLLLLHPGYTMLVAVRIYHSLGLAVVLPGISALVAEMSPPGRIGTYLGSTRIFFNIGMLSGPSAAILLISSHGYVHWLIVSAATSLAALLLVSAVTVPLHRHPAVNAKGIWSQMRTALSVKRIYPIMAAIAIFSFSYSAVVSFAKVYLETLESGVDGAYFFFILGLAGIVTSLVAGRVSDQVGREKIAWPMVFTLGLGVIIFALLPRWETLLIVSAVVLGIGIQGSNLIFGAWLIDIARPELRATTISLQENMIDTCFALGAITFGLAAQGPGLGPAFMITGILTALSVFLLSGKSLFRVRRQP